jgi:hypothetical protein
MSWDPVEIGSLQAHAKIFYTCITAIRGVANAFTHSKTMFSIPKLRVVNIAFVGTLDSVEAVPIAAPAFDVVPGTEFPIPTLQALLATYYSGTNLLFRRNLLDLSLRLLPYTESTHVVMDMFGAGQHWRYGTA